MNFGKIATAIGAAALIATTPAGAACWSPRAIEAARIRDFETTLMVETLRCRTKGVEMTEDYNRLVREKRAVLTGVNDELRAQLADGRTGKAALDAYDRFVTAVANSHGAGSPALGCSDYAAILHTAVLTAADRGALLALAVSAGADPALPSEQCVAQIALAH